MSPNENPGLFVHASHLGYFLLGFYVLFVHNGQKDISEDQFWPILKNVNCDNSMAILVLRKNPALHEGAQVYGLD